MVSTLIVGHLRKVGLLPTKVVELIDALIEIGMFVVVSGLLLCLPMFSSDMSSFRQQLVPPLAGRSRAGSSRPSAHTPTAHVSVPSLAPRPQ